MDNINDKHLPPAITDKNAGSESTLTDFSAKSNATIFAQKNVESATRNLVDSNSLPDLLLVDKTAPGSQLIALKDMPTDTTQSLQRSNPRVVTPEVPNPVNPVTSTELPANPALSAGEKVLGAAGIGLTIGGLVKSGIELETEKLKIENQNEELSRTSENALAQWMTDHRMVFDPKTGQPYKVPEHKSTQHNELLEQKSVSASGDTSAKPSNTADLMSQLRSVENKENQHMSSYKDGLSRTEEAWKNLDTIINSGYTLTGAMKDDLQKLNREQANLNQLSAEERKQFSIAASDRSQVQLHPGDPESVRKAIQSNEKNEKLINTLDFRENRLASAIDQERKIIKANEVFEQRKNTFEDTNTLNKEILHVSQENLNIQDSRTQIQGLNLDINIPEAYKTKIKQETAAADEANNKLQTALNRTDEDLHVLRMEGKANLNNLTGKVDLEADNAKVVRQIVDYDTKLDAEAHKLTKVVATSESVEQQYGKVLRDFKEAEASGIVDQPPKPQGPYTTDASVPKTPEIRRTDSTSVGSDPPSVPQEVPGRNAPAKPLRTFPEFGTVNPDQKLIPPLVPDTEHGLNFHKKGDETSIAKFVFEPSKQPDINTFAGVVEFPFKVAQNGPIDPLDIQYSSLPGDSPILTNEVPKIPGAEANDVNESKKSETGNSISDGQKKTEPQANSEYDARLVNQGQLALKPADQHYGADGKLQAPLQLPGGTDRNREIPNFNYDKVTDFPGAAAYGDREFKGEITATMVSALLATKGPDYDGPIHITAKVNDGGMKNTVDYLHKVFPRAHVVVFTAPNDVVEKMSERKPGAAFDLYLTEHMNVYRYQPQKSGETVQDMMAATNALAQEIKRDPGTMERVAEGMRAPATPEGRAEVLNYLHSRPNAEQLGLMDPNVRKAIIFVRDKPGEARNMTPELLDQIMSELPKDVVPVIMGDRLPGYKMPSGAIDMTEFFRDVPLQEDQAYMFYAMSKTGTKNAIGMMSAAMDTLKFTSNIKTIQFGPVNRLGALEEALGPEQYDLVPLGPMQTGNNNMYPRHYYDSSNPDKHTLAEPALEEFRKSIKLQFSGAKGSEDTSGR